LKDDLPMQEFIMKTVANRADVEFVTNSDDALTKYRASGPYDLVMTDLVHEGLDGLGLSKAIREINQTQRIVAFTGDVLEANTAFFEELGVQVFSKRTIPDFFARI
jgi:CheY-like chemotaxis protein